MTYISRCLTCHEPVDGSIAYCVACRQIDAINRQTKKAAEVAEQQAEQLVKQASRQEQLERDRIWEQRQLEEYRQREKLLDLIPGYRQQQALELAEKMKREKEEQVRYERELEERGAMMALANAEFEKKQEEKRVRDSAARTKAAEDTMTTIKKNPVGTVLVLIFVLVAAFLCYDNGFIAISLGILGTVGATVTNLVFFRKNTA